MRTIQDWYVQSHVNFYFQCTVAWKWPSHCITLLHYEGTTNLQLQRSWYQRIQMWLKTKHCPQHNSHSTRKYLHILCQKCTQNKENKHTLSQINRPEIIYPVRKVEFIRIFKTINITQHRTLKPLRMRIVLLLQEKKLKAKRMQSLLTVRT
jgi:hypothetical protein